MYLVECSSSTLSTWSSWSSCKSNSKFHVHCFCILWIDTYICIGCTPSGLLLCLLHSVSSESFKPRLDTSWWTFHTLNEGVDVFTKLVVLEIQLMPRTIWLWWCTLLGYLPEQTLLSTSAILLENNWILMRVDRLGNNVFLTRLLQLSYE